MLKQYETVFIATPVLSEEQIKEAVEKYRGFIISEGGEIVNDEDWGLRKLAYPIQKKIAYSERRRSNRKENAAAPAAENTAKEE